MNRIKIIFSAFAILLLFPRYSLPDKSEPGNVYIRVNQAGYLPQDTKKAIAFSNHIFPAKFTVVDVHSKNVVYTGRAKISDKNGWAPFRYFYELDFSGLKKDGEYEIIVDHDRYSSQHFRIGDSIYKTYADEMLDFMRQQRCGYNPFFDQVCHQKDARMMYGPLPDSTYVDVTGGWHDAGDQLKYLITGSFATAIMMEAYQLAPSLFKDSVNALGQAGPNGIPDVLDEA